MSGFHPALSRPNAGARSRAGRLSCESAPQAPLPLRGRTPLHGRPVGVPMPGQAAIEQVGLPPGPGARRADASVPVSQRHDCDPAGAHATSATRTVGRPPEFVALLLQSASRTANIGDMSASATRVLVTPVTCQPASCSGYGAESLGEGCHATAEAAPTQGSQGHRGLPRVSHRPTRGRLGPGMPQVGGGSERQGSCS
jgi:hypothetical protein